MRSDKFRQIEDLTPDDCPGEVIKDELRPLAIHQVGKWANFLMNDKCCGGCQNRKAENPLEDKSNK